MSKDTLALANAVILIQEVELPVHTGLLRVISPVHVGLSPTLRSQQAQTDRMPGGKLRLNASAFPGEQAHHSNTAEVDESNVIP